MIKVFTTTSPLSLNLKAVLPDPNYNAREKLAKRSCLLLTVLCLFFTTEDKGTKVLLLWEGSSDALG
jgi:hypothetical protein